MGLCSLYISFLCHTTTLTKYCGEVSAYNLEASQTDNSPQIGAGNHNLGISRALGICASRDLPLHTIVHIKGYGDCEILDRMGTRYKGTGNIDILMPTRQEALNWGRQKRLITIK
jgi:3D (Asp-Asp-Asp) domain-containing protein